MDVSLKDIAPVTPKTRRYFKLPSAKGSKRVEVEYLSEDQIPSINDSKITKFRENHSKSPNFVLDGIRHRIRLSLGMRIILVFCTSVMTLITLLVFGDYGT